MKSRIINNKIEDLNLNAPFIIDIKTGKQLYCGSVKYMTDEQISEQGFKEIAIPEPPEGKQLDKREIQNGEIVWTFVDKVEMKIFDVVKFKDDLKIELGERMRVLYPVYAIILDNLKTPMFPEHYLTIKQFMAWWLEDGVVTQDDINKFVKCFSNQDIDIINY